MYIQKNAAILNQPTKKLSNNKLSTQSVLNDNLSKKAINNTDQVTFSRNKLNKNGCDNVSFNGMCSLLIVGGLVYLHRRVIKRLFK